MASSPKEALAKAGLPSVRIGGAAYRHYVSGGLSRMTDDMDLAITLPRGVDLRLRRIAVNRTMLDLKFHAGGGDGDDFAFYWRDGGLIHQVDIFLDGIWDFDHKPEGTGLKLFVDDERGRFISREGLLISKLISARPLDCSDVAGLLLGGIFDRDALLRKIQAQVSRPDYGRRHMARTLRTLEAMFAEGGTYRGPNRLLDARRKDIYLRAVALRTALEG